MKSTYYHTCENCGANLDPGEKCDCQSAQTTLRTALSVKSMKYSTGAKKPLRTAQRAS